MGWRFSDCSTSRKSEWFLLKLSPVSKNDIRREGLNSSFADLLASGSSMLGSTFLLSTFFPILPTMSFSFWKEKKKSFYMKKMLVPGHKIALRGKLKLNSAWWYLNTKRIHGSFLKVKKITFYFRMCLENSKASLFLNFNWQRTCNCFVWRNWLLKDQVWGVQKSAGSAPCPAPLEHLSLPPLWGHPQSTSECPKRGQRARWLDMEQAKRWPGRCSRKWWDWFF